MCYRVPHVLHHDRQEGPKMKQYTIREAAEALGVTKPTAARYARMLPEAETMQDSYRGQPRTLISEAGLNRIRTMLGEAQAQSEAQKEAQNQEERSTSSAKFTASSEKKRKDATEELIAALQARITAQDSTISTLTAALAAAQDATAAAQALHAATAAELRKLTAAKDMQPGPPETPQEEREPGEGNDTTPRTVTAQEGHQEPRNADQTNQAPGLGQRLKYLFTGKP